MEYRFVPEKAPLEPESTSGQGAPEPPIDPAPAPAPLTEGNWLPAGAQQFCQYQTSRFVLRPLYDGFVHRRIHRQYRKNTIIKEARRAKYVAGMKWKEDTPRRTADGVLEYLDELPSVNMDGDLDEAALEAQFEEGPVLEDLPQPSRKRTQKSNDPDKIAATHRQTRIILEMGLQGHTMSAIARALKISPSTARSLYEKALSENYGRSSVAKLRRQQLALLMRMQVAIYPAAMGWVERKQNGERQIHLPDLNAQGRLLDICKQVAAITGMNVNTTNVNVAMQGLRRAAKLNPDVAFAMMRAGLAKADQLSGGGNGKPSELEYDPGPLDGEMSLE